MGILRRLSLSGKSTEADLVEGMDRRLQMASRQVQIDGRLFQAPMPEEQLDRAQVGAGFEHVSSEAVSQRVRP